VTHTYIKTAEQSRSARSCEASAATPSGFLQVAVSKPRNPAVLVSAFCPFALPIQHYDFSLPIACPDLDYFRFADDSVLFVGATNLIPPVSTSSLAAGRHNRKNQLDR